ncbi:contractile injection system tape measure protein [uncultured Flavobacterium sp.]|uniref:contractile injection system tape measure protein n=1 Tax=uncultured Flavobacterium sp. TaxID=165435 RepID=UPI002930AC5A|nr:contractile injection system tape measure protein [uncultured Flavobacterium sp.]
MTKNTHSIQKVFLEIDTPSILTANSIKNNLAMFVQNEVVPILEKQFNTIENINNQIVQIEKIEISINSNTGKTDLFLSNSEAKNDIKNQIEKEIQKRLNEVQKTTKKESENESEIRTISPENKDLKTLLYFIENGKMPWWVSAEDEISFFEKVNFENLKNDIFKNAFNKLIQQKKIQNRIINQFSNQEIAHFTSALLDSETQQKTHSKNKLIQFLNNKSHEFKTAFWQLLFEVSNEKKSMEIIRFFHQKQTEFSSEKMPFELFIQNLRIFFPLATSDTELKKMNDDYLDSEKTKLAPQQKSTIENLKNDSANKPEMESKKDENFQEEKDSSESCYVQNAGLIILHPFLKEMLKNCGLIGDNNTIKNKELAAHILHYAATKKENDFEHLMLFEKFLCGIEIEESIQREIKIEEKYKQQVEEMLLSVLEHWTALKSTSTDLLRTEFLQREGKLDWSESNPKLTIERKTQDLLLEKIPWNINIVKIPWIEKLIYTQW